jgi:hypothetical protein
VAVLGEETSGVGHAEIKPEPEASADSIVEEGAPEHVKEEEEEDNVSFLLAVKCASGGLKLFLFLFVYYFAAVSEV